MRAVKKALLYALIIAALVAASFIVNEVRLAKEAVRNPEAFRAGGGVDANRQPTAEIFSEPPAGKAERMTPSELAWMLRERITLDVMERFASRGRALDIYNERVAAYNARGGTIAYAESDMAEAKRRVERSLDLILGDAIDESLEISMPPDAPDRAIWTAQKYLGALSLFPAEPDGKPGDSTAHAVRMFQASVGVPVTGRVDEELLEQLRESLALKLKPTSVGF